MKVASATRPIHVVSNYEGLTSMTDWKKHTAALSESIWRSPNIKAFEDLQEKHSGELCSEKGDLS
jgi:hypothetical protein